VGRRPGGSGGPGVAEVGVEVTGLDKSISASGLMTNSGESRTAESMMTLVMCCKDGVIWVGFHCSSSTILAEREMRAWWNACKNALACIGKKNQTIWYWNKKELGYTWLTITPLSPTIIRRHMISHLTTKLQDSSKKVKNSGSSRAACSSTLREIIPAACVLESSAAEERISASSSRMTIDDVGDGVYDSLGDGLVALQSD